MSVVKPQERREGYIEVTHQFVERMTHHVDEEEGFFRGFKIFSWVFGIVFSALIGLGTWVFVEKNQDFRKVQDTINEHTAQNGRTLTMLENIMAEQNRIHLQAEKNTELMYRHLGDKR